jgi:hypothetical protein
VPVLEPEARPWPLVRRGNEAVVEKAGAAIGTGGEVMEMVDPVEMPLLSHPHTLSHRDLSAPQTSNHDVCATRRIAASGYPCSEETLSVAPTHRKRFISSATARR